jgi:hypothetical protein
LWNDGGAPVDLNTLVTPASEVNVSFPVYINDRGEIVAHAVLPNGDVHAVVLIPCDESHPNLEGCNYGTVAAVTVAADPAGSAKIIRPATFETAKRLRFRKMDHGQWF